MGYTPWRSQGVGHNWVTKHTHKHTHKIKQKGSCFLCFSLNTVFLFFPPDERHTSWWVMSTSDYSNAIPVHGLWQEAVLWDIKIGALPLGLLASPWRWAAESRMRDLWKGPSSHHELVRGQHWVVVCLWLLALSCYCPCILDILTCAQPRQEHSVPTEAPGHRLCTSIELVPSAESSRELVKQIRILASFLQYSDL